MKTLPKARFYRVHHEKPRVLQFVVFGPVVKERQIERWYVFNESQNPQIINKFSVEEGEKMKDQQKVEPVVVHSSALEKIFWFKDVFVLCTSPDEDQAVVKGFVIDQEERRAKRLEKLRKKGEQAT